MVSEATGREHLTPVKIKDTSATERAGFRQCRRRWFLTIVHRLDPQEGNPNFFLGTIYHEGLQGYYSALLKGASHKKASRLALDAYERAFHAEMEKLRPQLGFLWKVAEPQWRALGELGFEMLQNYLDKEPQSPLFDEVVAVEFRVRIAIRDRVGKKVGELTVQADAVGYKDGELKVVDHKTASRDMDSAHLDIDDQLTAEVYSWWKDSGNFPEKAVYNVSYKKTAKPPEQIKGTKKEPVRLSKNKGQGTTYELYRAEVERLGLDKRNYADILAYLKNLDEMGENKFFDREETFRTPDQMAAFERDLYWEFHDMKEVAAEPERAYPNPSRFNCPGCPVRPVCFAIQDGQDVASLIQAGYVIGDPRR